MRTDLRVALVGGPMYDHLYPAVGLDPAQYVVHADHPTLNSRVADLLGRGERIDVLSTHSKYAPSQADWLWPLDELLAPEVLAPLAERAVDLCRHEGRLLSVPRMVDVRVLWFRADRRAQPPATWTELVDDGTVFGFTGRDSGLFGLFFELVAGEGGTLFVTDDTGGVHPTLDTEQCITAVSTIETLARRAPHDLATWHYDDVDAALLDGRVDASAAWPGGWSAIRDGALADVLRPARYPAGSRRWVSYSGCHSWAIPRTCADVDAAVALIEQLCSDEAHAADAVAGTMCAHRGVLSAVEAAATDPVDRQRLTITRATIDEAMITYPSLACFPEIEDAGWRAIQSVVVGTTSPERAAEAMQVAALRALGRR